MHGGRIRGDLLQAESPSVRRLALLKIWPPGWSLQRAGGGQAFCTVLLLARTRVVRFVMSESDLRLCRSTELQFGPAENTAGLCVCVVVVVVDAVWLVQAGPVKPAGCCISTVTGGPFLTQALVSQTMCFWGVQQQPRLCA